MERHIDLRSFGFKDGGRIGNRVADWMAKANPLVALAFWTPALACRCVLCGEATREAPQLSVALPSGTPDFDAGLRPILALPAHADEIWWGVCALCWRPWTDAQLMELTAQVRRTAALAAVGVAPTPLRPERERQWPRAQAPV